MKNHIATLAIASGAFVMAAGQALAATYTGAVYPPPGGVTFTNLGGAAKDAGGSLRSYTNFDLSQSGDLYFGVAGYEAMDQSINETGETLMLDLANSNLAGGVAVFSGNTDLNGTPVFSRMRLTFTDMTGGALSLIQSSSLGLDASGLGVVGRPAAGANTALLLVTGDYKLRTEFLASSSLNGGYSAAGSYYDNTQFKPVNYNGLQTGTNGGFYYTAAVPEPASWALMIGGFAGAGLMIRRRRTVRA